jgi:autoinducer 2-degrading protein
MVVTLVKVHVKADHIDDFIKATIENHEHSVREKGNRRFDILQSPENPSLFQLYEAYENENDAAEHKKTPHYLAWKTAVEPWMETPRQGVPYKVIRPL